MNDILGVPPGLEDLHEVVTKDYLRKIAFRKLLGAVLAESLATNTSTPYNIINLGCRRGDDTDDIAACFEEAKRTHKHTAIDCDDGAIKYATATNPNQHTTYISDNAADPQIKELYPAQIDLVLLRHPEIWRNSDDLWNRNDDVWFDMVAHAWSKSNDESQIIITVYNETEYKLVERTFTKLPKTILVASTINPYRDQTLTQWNYRTSTLNCPDHYIVRLKKKPV